MGRPNSSLHLSNSHFTSQILSFLICKMGIITSTSWSCCEGKTIPGTGNCLCQVPSHAGLVSAAGGCPRRAHSWGLLCLGLLVRHTQVLHSHLPAGWIMLSWGFHFMDDSCGKVEAWPSISCTADGRPDSDKWSCVLSTHHSCPVRRSWSVFQAPAQKRGRGTLFRLPGHSVISLFFFKRGSAQYRTQPDISTIKALGSNF